MPFLNWIGKDKVVTHDLEVPFHSLNFEYSYRNKETLREEFTEEDGNLLIHGDNLLALKALLPTYEERIDCIYIDPPYNTGNEEWVYNDNVNSPQIRKWMNKIVGKEGDDLSRHDKWLCMMYPRLVLLKKLLNPDGVLVISIGFQELSNLVAICREIFGNSQIQIVTVQTSGGKLSSGFTVTHEYLVFITNWNFSPNPSESAKTKYSSPYHGMNLATFNQESRPNQAYPIFVDNDGVVTGVGESLQELIETGKFTKEKKDYEYDFSIAPEGSSAVWPITKKGDKCVWRLVPESFLDDWNNGFIKIVPINQKNNPNKFSIQYLADGIKTKIKKGEFKTRRFSENPRIPTLEVEEFKTGGVGIPTIWQEKKFYTAQGGNELTQLFGNKNVFPYPKSLALITEILERVTKKDSIILDSFAGSGTTAQAVLELNKKDGGRRKFICIEMMDYAKTITAERIKKTIDGYKADDQEEELLFSEEITVKSLEYAPETLQLAYNEKEKADSSGLFKKTKIRLKDNNLQIIGVKKSESSVSGTGGSFSFFELGLPYINEKGQLDESIDNTELRKFIWKMETHSSFKPTNEEVRGFVGSHNDTSIYLFYDNQNPQIFNREALRLMTHKSANYVVYAESTIFPEEELARRNITFKKIPRDIKKS